MNLKKYLPLLALLLPVTLQAQPFTQAQLDQFQQLPRAQQEALARQYGVDLSNLGGSAMTGSQQRLTQPQVVEPLGQIRDDERDQAYRRGQDSEPKADDGVLKPFGYDLFAGSPSTFAPVTEIPIPADYRLGPGDVIRVQMWGNQNQLLSLPVSRDGTIDFPQSGPRPVAGLTFEEASRQIRELVAEQYIGVRAAVSLGELRSMRIFVLGEARVPGAYTVSSLSTMTNALFVSGGIRTSGSLRAIRHMRDGELIGELDLYDLLLKGDTRNDARLQPGDVIFIPPVGPHVAIEGEVYRPALYEVKGNLNINELVAFAGGLTPQAFPQRARLTRLNESFQRVIEEADLTSNSDSQRRLRAGDRLKVASVSDITGQYIAIEGAAVRPGRYAWIPGMRVSSVLGSLRADLSQTADTQYAAIVRTNPETDHISVLNLRLRDAVQNPGGEHDLVLQERDRILIFSDEGKVAAQKSQTRNQTESDTEEKKSLADYSRERLFAPVLERLRAQASPGQPLQTIRISGQVRYPGEYPMPATRSLADAIFVAGGLKDSASLLVGELARMEIDDRGDAFTRVLQLDLSGGLEGIDLQLQSRDRILIKPIPEFAQRMTITLSGEVRFPGEYTFRKGETLNDVIQRAGGLTDNAFPSGAVFTRERLRRLEAQRLQEAEERLQSELVSLQLEGETVARQQTSAADIQDLLDNIRSARPMGRLVFDLQASMAGVVSQQIRLQDGDMLIIPPIPQSVSVFGEVQFPTSHLHQPGLTVEDYLERSGGPTRQADVSRVYVVKADGSVSLPKRSRWFTGRAEQLEPGDTIIMPLDVERFNQLQLWTNVSQIIYQIALGAAAVSNL
ncbi:MAG: SLBB domain-containing protein [Marinobacter sp.]|nr:SLBB domain-containing protein [Marinobacter sp.]